MNKQDFMKLPTCVLRVNLNCACDGCKQKVKKLLTKLDGVYSTIIDVEQGKVTVTGNADPAILIKKLEKSGKHAEIWGVATTGKKQQQLKNSNNDSFVPGNNKGGGGGGGGKGMKDNHHQAQIEQKMAKGFKDFIKDAGNKDKKKQDQKSVKFNLPHVVDDDFDVDDEFDDDDSCFDDEDEFYDEDDCFDDFDQNQQHYPPSTKMMPPPMGLGVPHAHVKADGKNTKKGGGGVGGFELPSLQQFKGMTLGKDGKSKTTTNSDDSSNKKSSNAKGAGKKDDGKGKTKGVDGKNKTKGDDSKNKTKGDDGKSKTKGDDGKKGGGLSFFGGKKSGGFLGVLGKTGGGKKNGDSKPADNGEKMNLDASKKGGGQGQTKGQSNSKQNGASGNMDQIGQMGQMGQMGMGGYPMPGNFPGQMRAAQGLPAQVNPGYFPGQGYDPYNNQLQQQLLQQQQQYMAAMMMKQQQQQQQQLLQQRGYPPMMYGQPQGPITYGPAVPPAQDNFSHIFSDENTDSCSIM